MPLNKTQKTEQIEFLKEKISQANSVIFARNHGLSVSALSQLRASLREAHLDCKVAKKTLFRIAAEENGIKDIPADVMEGPVITIFGYEDQAVPAKILDTFAKKSEKKFELIGGILDKVVIDKEKVLYLASLPSREQLIAQLMSVMNGPARGFVGTLNAIPTSLARVINAYQEKLKSESPTETAASEAKVEEAKDAPAKESKDTAAEAPTEEVKSEAEIPAEETKSDTESPIEN